MHGFDHQSNEWHSLPVDGSQWQSTALVADPSELFTPQSVSPVIWSMATNKAISWLRFHSTKQLYFVCNLETIFAFVLKRRDMCCLSLTFALLFSFKDCIRSLLWPDFCLSLQLVPIFANFVSISSIDFICLHLGSQLKVYFSGISYFILFSYLFCWLEFVSMIF